MIEIYHDESNKYRWRRRSANGQVTAQGQSHTFKFNAKRAATKQFPLDPVVDLTKQVWRVSGL